MALYRVYVETVLYYLRTKKQLNRIDSRYLSDGIIVNCLCYVNRFTVFMNSKTRVGIIELILKNPLNFSKHARRHPDFNANVLRQRRVSGGGPQTTLSERTNSESSQTASEPHSVEDRLSSLPSP